MFPKLIGGIAESNPSVTPPVKAARILSVIYFEFYERTEAVWAEGGERNVRLETNIALAARPVQAFGA
jgi:hypothetical protein